LQRGVVEDTRIATVANLVSLLRLVLAIAVLVLARRDQMGTALALFVIAVAADSFDGYMARRLNQVSKLGVLLDPLVDHALVLTGIAGLLGSSERLPAAMVTLLNVAAGRGVVVLVLGAGFYGANQSPKPNRAAHAASVLAMAGVAATYLGTSVPSEAVGRFHAAAAVLIIASLGFTLASFRNYAVEIAAGRVWKRGESFNETFPAREIEEALRRFHEVNHAAHRRLLERVLRENPDSKDETIIDLLRAKHRSIDREIHHATERRRMARVGELEEMRRVLLELLRLLGAED
jgi:cardiolipin synthase